MINFRYHLVSLMAVFLSLTLGIALGSTVVKQGVLDVLKHRAATVKHEADVIDQTNKTLQSRIDAQIAYSAATAPAVVAGKLAGAKVVLLALRGVDGAAVQSMAVLLQRAGAVTPAIVWLESKWALASDADRTALRSALGTNVDDGGLLGAGMRLLSNRIAHTPTSVAPTDNALVKLSNAGFISVERVGTTGPPDLNGFPGGDAAVVAVVGRGTTIDTGTYIEIFTEALSRAMVEDALPLVLGERDSDPVKFPQPGTAMRLMLSSREVSTVDSLAAIEGRVAAVLAVAAMRNGTVGHYGDGPGSTRPLPVIP